MVKGLVLSKERVAVVSGAPEHGNKSRTDTASVVLGSHCRRTFNRARRGHGCIGQQTTIDDTDGHRPIPRISKVAFGHAVGILKDFMICHLAADSTRSLFRVPPAGSLISRQGEA